MKKKSEVVILEAKFIASAEQIGSLAKSSVPEVVILGRSNVGKSSLINALLQRKALAKTSSTPGKTKTINLFEVKSKYNSEIYQWNIIDLPGFGYAAISKEQKKRWQKNLSEFLKKRETIKLFLLLRDARIPVQEIDEIAREFIESFRSANQIVVDIYTKIDKLSQAELFRIKQKVKEPFFVSSTSYTNIDALRAKIIEILFFKDATIGD